ncbi:MAG: DUF3108 domain-containing protein [Pseudobdellovibrionaceae bacterium]
MSFKTYLRLFSCTFLLLGACSSSTLKYDNSAELQKNKEFEQAVKIGTSNDSTKASQSKTEQVPSSQVEAPAQVTSSTVSAKNKAKKKGRGKIEKKKSSETDVNNQSTTKSDQSKQTEKIEKTEPPQAIQNAQKSNQENPEQTKGTGAASDKEVNTTNKPVADLSVTTRRQPEIEDEVGFKGRRPLQDPFRVGEEVVHDVSYFKVSAGELRFKVEPFSTVNNRKSYQFAMEIRTSPLFSNFYSVEDRVEIFVDYEDLMPRVFQLHVKESKQLREAKMLFDPNDSTATFWEKKVTKDNGEEEKKQHWEILPFSQNVYSIVFYMRNFKWETGKEYAFHVANDNENLVFSGKAIRREVLETKLGPMKAIVIQPNIVLKGKFKPIGDNYIWLSDDDRKYVLRIESKIKIGTLVSEVVSINPGTSK